MALKTIWSLDAEETFESVIETIQKKSGQKKKYAILFAKQML